MHGDVLGGNSSLIRVFGAVSYCEASTNWGHMMAASIVAAVPVTIIFVFLFVFLQRYFIQGLTSGAVKG